MRRRFLIKEEANQQQSTRRDHPGRFRLIRNQCRTSTTNSPIRRINPRNRRFQCATEFLIRAPTKYRKEKRKRAMTMKSETRNGIITQLWSERNSHWKSHRYTHTTSAFHKFNAVHGTKHIRTLRKYSYRRSISQLKNFSFRRGSFSS